MREMPMKIADNISIYTGGEYSLLGKSIEQDKKQTGSIYAGDLNKNILGDKIAQRKEQAKKQAMKVVKDVWESDRALDEDLEARRTRIEELRKEMRNAESQKKGIEDLQKQLQKEYGITEDSQEQRDLELLRKKYGYGRTGGGIANMTKEEMEYVSRLEAEGLTEYQQRQLDFDKEKKVYEEQYAECFQNIRIEVATISATKLERLKHSPMVNAQKQAEQIEQAASDEILGMLVEEGKEQIDEKQEENKEKAEAIEKQREEQEEFIEAQREKNKEAKELIEEVPVDEMLSLEQTKTDVQREVQNIVDKMKLVVEDIKGCVVDENI